MSPPLNRPRPFAERLKSPPARTIPVAVNDNGDVLGAWDNGVFHFTSPDAHERWRRKSYEQGVGEETWHFGKEIDHESAAIARAGLGGASPGLYQAPDGTYRLMNARTIESKEARDHRNKHLIGKTIDQIAAANSMPGADEWVARGMVAQGAANDNAASPNGNSSQTNVVTDSNGSTVSPPSDFPDRVTRASIYYRSPETGEMVLRTIPYEGRSGFGGSTQGGRDAMRVLGDAVLGDSIEEIQAGWAAGQAWLNGGSLSKTYEEEQPKEEAESQAAEERLGLAAPAIQLAVSLVPGIGDGSGAIADIKDWMVNGASWDKGDYGMAFAGAIPLVPGRKQLESGKKLLDGVIDKVRSTWKEEGEELFESADRIQKSGIDDLGRVDAPEDFEFEQLLPNSKTEFYTEAEALSLAGDNRGLIYVVENEPRQPHARWYQDETPGTFYSIKHRKPVVPALRYDSPKGKDLIRFDGIEKAEDGPYLVLIDSKTAMPPNHSKKIESTLERVGLALTQNNAASKIPLKVFYDFPTEKEAARAQRILNWLGYADIVHVRVRPATAKGQELFEKLREK